MHLISPKEAPLLHTLISQHFLLFHDACCFIFDCSLSRAELLCMPTVGLSFFCVYNKGWMNWITHKWTKAIFFFMNRITKKIPFTKWLTCMQKRRTRKNVVRIRLLPPKSVFLDLSQQKQEVQWDVCVLSPVIFAYLLNACELWPDYVCLQCGLCFMSHWPT